MRRHTTGRTTVRTAAVGAAAVVPFAALVLQAGADEWHGDALIPQRVGTRGLRALWTEPALFDAIAGSLIVAIVVAFIATVVAWPAARFLATSPSAPAWFVLAAPVLLPPLVLGDGLAPWLLALGLNGGWASIGVAHLAIAVPYATLGLVAVFGADFDELEQSAALLGASPQQRLRQVLLPFAAHHVALALALSFTVSWSQYATSLRIGGGTPMLPLVLVPYVRSDPQVAAVLTIVFLFPPVAALSFTARMTDRRRFGDIVGVAPNAVLSARS